LNKGVVEAKAFGTLYLEMHAFDGGDDVRRLVAAAELATPASLDAEEAPKLGRGLTFATLAFVAGSQAH